MENKIKYLSIGLLAAGLSLGIFVAPPVEKVVKESYRNTKATLTRYVERRDPATYEGLEGCLVNIIDGGQPLSNTWYRRHVVDTERGRFYIDTGYGYLDNHPAMKELEREDKVRVENVWGVSLGAQINGYGGEAHNDYTPRLKSGLKKIWNGGK